jgi:hypothetical protein
MPSLDLSAAFEARREAVKTQAVPHVHERLEAIVSAAPVKTSDPAWLWQEADDLTSAVLAFTRTALAVEATP